MKKTIRIITLCALMALGGLTIVNGQGSQAQRDTVNMDTDAVPTFYYSVEDRRLVLQGKRVQQVQLQL